MESGERTKRSSSFAHLKERREGVMMLGEKVKRRRKNPCAGGQDKMRGNTISCQFEHSWAWFRPEGNCAHDGLHKFFVRPDRSVNTSQGKRKEFIY